MCLVFSKVSVNMWVKTDDLDLMTDMRHEVLCYLQLLETNKPYIVNLLRVPGMV